MNWKLKAATQTVVAMLPTPISYATYYWIQRRFGDLRSVNPLDRLGAGIDIWTRIRAQGYDPFDKVFLEVGTGRIPLVPLAFWLLGANKTITIDLNPYLKEELVRESLQYISINREDIFRLFGSLLVKNRFLTLLDLVERSGFSVDEFLELCRINYIAPGDAGNTGLPENSISFHTSYTVFEHIPREDIRRILIEGNRIVKSDGLFVHRIDYSDHFSHSDSKISSINFLQYSDKEWGRFAGNRYMYMNRMRHDEFLELFNSVGHTIVDTKPDVDPEVQVLLDGGEFQLNERFQRRPVEVLEVKSAWIVSINGAKRKR